MHRTTPQFWGRYRGLPRSVQQLAAKKLPASQGGPASPLASVQESRKLLVGSGRTRAPGVGGRGGRRLHLGVDRQPPRVRGDDRQEMIGENPAPPHLNSTLTDSFQWIRLIASPSSGAMPSTVIRGMAFSGGRGIVSVMTRPSIGRLVDPLDGAADQQAVRGGQENLPRAGLVHHPGRPADRAGRADHVVEDQGRLALAPACR